MQKNRQVQKSKWLDILIFVLFLNIFFFHSLGTVALALFLSGSYLLAVRLFGRVGAGPSVLFGASVVTMFLVSSPEKTLLLALLAIWIILTSVYRGMKDGEIGGILELGLSSLIVIREYIRSGLTILASALRGSLKDVLRLDYAPKERSPWVRSIFVGLLAGLPLVAWLVMTLSKADPVFATYIKDLVSEKFLTELPSRFALSMLSLFFLMPVVIMKWREYHSPLAWIARVRFGREMSVILAMVVVVMGLFLAVQWPYVFATVAKETDLSKYGVATYSEYVQKGFWDLLKVAAMVFGTSWITLLIAKNQKGSERKILLYLQAILGVEFVVFIVSIFRRVWLYQSYHGLTLARLYGLVLLTWLVGMMITMGLRYLYQNVRWVKVEIAWIVIVIFGSIALNMESLIVKDPPTVNGRVDYVYLSRLSGDGYEGWMQAYEWADKVLTTQSKAEGPNGHIGFVEPNDRRDIYYAGLIARQLASHYHDLVMANASEEELKDYDRKIIESQIEVLQWWERDFKKGDGLSRLDEDLKKLDTDSWTEKVWVTKAPTLGMYYPGSTTFYFTQQQYEVPSFFFDVFETRSKDYLIGLDRVLTYDLSRVKTYQWMKANIGVEKILELQNQYISLHNKISDQPDGARNVDIDISLDSPFLR